MGGWNGWMRQYQTFFASFRFFSSHVKKLVYSQPRHFTFNKLRDLTGLEQEKGKASLSPARVRTLCSLRISTLLFAKPPQPSHTLLNCHRADAAPNHRIASTDDVVVVWLLLQYVYKKINFSFLVTVHTHTLCV